MEFEFTCANRECRCLNEGIGLYFTTKNIMEAEKHSRENDSPMWISKTNTIQELKQLKLQKIEEKI